MTWGDAMYGGDSTAEAVKLTSGVRSIYSTESSFAAVKEGGEVPLDAPRIILSFDALF